MSRYWIRHGRFWMVQYSRRIFFSLGIHLDFELRYIDLHLGCLILTLGDMEREYDQYQAWWSSREKQ